MHTTRTACEEYGHEFEDGWCRDCGERQEPENKEAPAWLINLTVVAIIGAIVVGVVWLVVWGVMSLWHWADDQDKKYAAWCDSQGGHVLVISNVVTTYGANGVGVGTTTLTYCLSADGKVLDIQ